MIALRQQLGAEVRRFYSVQGAMRWRWARQQGRESLTGTLGASGVGTVRSAEERDRENATYALLTRCLESADRDTDGFHLRYVGLFEAWCCSFESQAELGASVGMKLSELRRTMNWTEQILRRRMESRGLL